MPGAGHELLLRMGDLHPHVFGDNIYGMNLTLLTTTIPPLDLRSCLISRDGQLLFEHYRHAGIPDELAKVNSCTKSMLSALVCIAMDKGMLPEPNTPIVEFFPTLHADPDPRKKDITIAHLLTMTPGFEWTEFGGIQSFPRMTRSDNWVEFVLSLPMSHPPGQRMAYSSGASQLLSAILAEACGMSVARFAEQELFGPLGIAQYEWETDPQGLHTGGYGLQLRPAHLLALGQLYLDRGRLETQQLVSEALAIRSVQPAVPAAPPFTGYYGWHWWADTYSAASGSFDYFYARGYGGQFLYVVPSLRIIVVLTNDKRKREGFPMNVFQDYIAPVLLG